MCDADVQFRSVEVEVMVPNGPFSDFISTKKLSDKSTGAAESSIHMHSVAITSVDYTTATTKHIHNMFEMCQDILTLQAAPVIQHKLVCFQWKF